MTKRNTDPRIAAGTHKLVAWGWLTQNDSASGASVVPIDWVEVTDTRRGSPSMSHSWMSVFDAIAHLGRWPESRSPGLTAFGHRYSRREVGS